MKQKNIFFLSGKKIAKRIQRVLGNNVKIIMILREPVARTISQYNMISDRSGTPGQLAKRGKLNGQSFDDVVFQDIQLIQNSKTSVTTTTVSIFKRRESVQSRIWKSTVVDISIRRERAIAYMEKHL